MPYHDGMAAINLEMPDRVPRTEYSVETHWDILSVVTGTHVDERSTVEAKASAQKAFMREWNFGFRWNILIDNKVFGQKRTRMGHAQYMADGVDYDDQLTVLYHDPEEALRFDPWELYGPRDRRAIVKAFNENYRAQCAFFSDAVNMTGVYVTCVSGLIDIFGWDMLLTAVGTDRKAFGELTDRYVSWIGQYFEALAECDASVVMVHDDIVWTSGPFLHPDWYRQYVFPNYRKLFRPLLDHGKKVMYTSDGTYTTFIDDIAACGVHGFVLEPTTDMKYIAEHYGKTHAFIGNADTRMLLSGSREDIRNEVKRCMDIGKGCPGFFMAVGNHIPPNTPVENALYYNEIYNELSRR